MCVYNALRSIRSQTYFLRSFVHGGLPHSKCLFHSLRLCVIEKQKKRTSNPLITSSGDSKREGIHHWVQPFLFLCFVSREILQTVSYIRAIHPFHPSRLNSLFFSLSLSGCFYWSTKSRVLMRKCECRQGEERAERVFLRFSLVIDKGQGRLTHVIHIYGSGLSGTQKWASQCRRLRNNLFLISRENARRRSNTNTSTCICDFSLINRCDFFLSSISDEEKADIDSGADVYVAFSTLYAQLLLLLWEEKY